jgi:tyrosinase
VAAFKHGKELAASSHTSRTQVLAFSFFVSILPLAATVAPMASAQSLSHLTSTGDIRLRKNVTALTIAERKDFVDAVLALKRARSPYDSSLSYYDQFVQWHKDRYVCNPAAHADVSTMQMVHAGPMFLPWHREFLRRFEDALREVSGKPITVPYWDWTDPESVNPDNPHSVFRDDFMGGSGSPSEGYAVTSGPFRKGEWTLKVHPEGASWTPSKTVYLTRNLGNVSTLPTKAEVDEAFAADEYDVPPFDLTSDRHQSFRNALEGERPANTMACGDDGWIGTRSSDPGTPGNSNRFTLHNMVHIWVGGIISQGDPRTVRRGTMILPTSPNDPVFFLHHANVDRLWSVWQARHPGRTYEPKTSHNGNSADSPMVPFERVTPQIVENIADLGYRYE